MADLITVRFLLRYVTRPLHLFGPIGFAATAIGALTALWVLAVSLGLLDACRYGFQDWGLDSARRRADCRG